MSSQSQSENENERSGGEMVEESLESPVRSTRASEAVPQPDRSAIARMLQGLDDARTALMGSVGAGPTTPAGSSTTTTAVHATNTRDPPRNLNDNGEELSSDDDIAERPRAHPAAARHAHSGTGASAAVLAVGGDDSSSDDGGVGGPAADDSAREPFEVRPEDLTRQFADAADWGASAAPFVSVVMTVMLIDHWWGLLLTTWLFSVLVHLNVVVSTQVARVASGAADRATLCFGALLAAVNVWIVYALTAEDQLHRYLAFGTPDTRLGLWDTAFVILVNDHAVRYAGVILKCALVAACPRRPGGSTSASRQAKRSLGARLAVAESAHTLLRAVYSTPLWVIHLQQRQYAWTAVRSWVVSTASMLIWIYLVVKLLHVLRLAARLGVFLRSSASGSAEYGRFVSDADAAELGGDCPICQDTYRDPIALPCNHAFCEECATSWLDRERTCPLCRAEVPRAGAKLFADGCTSLLPQIF